MPKPPGRHRCKDSPFAAAGHVIDLSDEVATSQEVSGILNENKSNKQINGSSGTKQLIAF